MVIFTTFFEYIYIYIYETIQISFFKKLCVNTLSIYYFLILFTWIYFIFLHNHIKIIEALFFYF